ncbi:glycosyl hydrolase family 18 protein [Conexibacter sp. CPCC 206217]|uniref:glycosyl hydrolase family 18 protein n=1 Tax=Conexibacter sp. CPCC 206217 TaxID=3064574 RepID=UPI002726A8E0|nr:glycosyl hydrolase family 18 protein [Conexibacter sp. CPCC 206217]MDO8209681.1 glycosyl hydrolase family 18 protein [Conexibacter sp. CPCC 206217]
MRTALATVTLIAAVTAAGLARGALGPAPAPAKPPARVFAFLSRADGLELTRLAQVGKRISVLAPNWYEVDVDTEALHEPWQPRPVLEAARRAGVPVWPVVNARTGGSAAIADPAARERLARLIAEVAADGRYAGITLDVEELLPTQRDDYSAFVQRLAALLHGAGRRLAVYAPRPASAGSALAYDLPALAKAADLLLVATYNETGPNAPPGPLDSSAGFDSVLRGTAAVSRTKAVPILGAFGYVWRAAGGPGQLVSTVDADRRWERCGTARTIADGNASYTCGDETVYHATAAGLRARARAAGAAGFRWVALFSLGREPRSFWDGMAAVRR